MIMVNRYWLFVPLRGVIGMKRLLFVNGYSLLVRDKKG